MSQSISSRVRRYIVENFLYMHREVKLNDGDLLLENGVLDSMGVMELIAFVQSEFRVSVDDDEITEDNFATVAAITRYVESKNGIGGLAEV